MWCGVRPVYYSSRAFIFSRCLLSNGQVGSGPKSPPPPLLLPGCMVGGVGPDGAMGGSGCVNGAMAGWVGVDGPMAGWLGVDEALSGWVGVDEALVGG